MQNLDWSFILPDSINETGPDFFVRNFMVIG